MTRLQDPEETQKPKAGDEAVHEDNQLDALIMSIGQFGKFQIKTYAKLTFTFICVALCTNSFVFTASSVKYRCIIRQCDTENSSYIEPFVNFTIPQSYGKLSQCKHYEASSENGSYCYPSYFNSSNLVDCEAGYKFLDNENTIAREFGIFCSDHWKLEMVGTIQSLGQFVAVVAGGYLSDRYGRKTILVISGVLTSFSGIAQSHAPNYGSFLFFEFLNLILSSSLHPTAFLLAMEMVTSEYRLAVIMGLSTVRTVFLMGLGPLASYLLDWRLLLRCVYTPLLLHLIFICVLPESVRWLLTQLREQEAIQILHKAARRNKRTIPDAQLHKLIHENRRQVALTKGYSIRQIYDDLGLRIALCCFIWFCARFIYLGLTLNSTQSTGSKFLNFSFMMFMDLPSNAITSFLLDRIGRRWTMFYLLSSCAVILVVDSFLVNMFPTVSWCLYFVALMTMMGSIYSLSILITEMSPTSYRNRIYSFCLMVGLTGSMIAPHTALLVKYYKLFPQYLFALFAGLSAVITLYLPETAHKVLPTTLEEACAIDKSMPTKQTKLTKAVDP